MFRSGPSNGCELFGMAGSGLKVVSDDTDDAWDWAEETLTDLLFLRRWFLLVNIRPTIETVYSQVNCRL